MPRLRSFQEYREALSRGDQDTPGSSVDLHDMAEQWQARANEIIGARSEQQLTSEQFREYAGACNNLQRFAGAAALADGGRHGAPGGGVDYDAIPVGAPERSTAVSARDVVLRADQRMADWVQARGLSDGVSARNADDISLGRMLRHMVGIGGRDDLSDGERRALSGNVDTAGGLLIPEHVSSRVIDLARARTRVFQAGAMLVPMPEENMRIVQVTGDAEPQWRGPNDDVVEDDLSFGSVTMLARTLAVLITVPRELLEDAPNVEATIRDSFAAQFALKLDYAALRGQHPTTPMGLLNDPAITKTEIGAGDGDVIDWDDIIDSLIGPLEDANEEPTAMIWAPRTKRSMSKLKDSQLRYLDPPTAVRDLPKLDTNQIPVDETVGTSDDCTEVYAGDWRQMFIGVRTNFFVEVLRERRADKFQYQFLAGFRGDTAAQRTNAFRVLTGVRS